VRIYSLVPPPVPLVRVEQPPPRLVEAPPLPPVTLHREIPTPPVVAPTVVTPPVTLYHQLPPAHPSCTNCCPIRP
jgi:hypothetical protein